ncbi:MAG: 4-hydroxy-3-methylbut-2-enyl diphosphate reductase [Deltaproteobacteria bacterium]|nr:4-hydroxy-3-methylbut-2-enyl diphosphate reductase [Deltaproteobacteria bacterium]
MEIILAKSAGFCFGVKRAINMATECATDEHTDDIHTLGPIIHNPQVVKNLEDKSKIMAKKSLDEIDSGTVIIRSHGVKLEELHEAGDKGLKVVDATCPFVKKAQEFVSELTRDGYSVIVVGEEEHPEVQGIKSFGGPDIIVAKNAEAIKGLGRKKKIGIVAQTTQSEKNLEEIANACMEKSDDVKICNTICSATSVRQTQSVDLAKEVDCMIVIGGKNSANTRRLAEICRSLQKNTFHIEVASELKSEWLTGVNKLGVTAGASTPDWIIENVLKRVEEISLEIEGNKKSA